MTERHRNHCPRQYADSIDQWPGDEHADRYDTAGRKMQGEIGIQLHRLPKAAMKMEVRNLRIKTS